MKVSRWIALAGVAAGHRGRDDVGGARRRFVVEDEQVVIQGRARQRRRRLQRRRLQQEPAQGSEQGREEGRRYGDPGGLSLDERLRAELQRRDPQGREHRRRGRLPARGDRSDVREEVPEGQVRDHRLLGARCAVRRQEGQRSARVQERRGHHVRGERVGLPRRRARGEDGARSSAATRSVRSAG